ncbi:TPA: Eaa protein [Salmonella enterica subsp. enterica serovar Infantis]
MTTITREQQKQILIDTANHVISRDNTSPYSENLRELARIALASLTAEPVLYAAEETLAYANMGEIHLTCLSEPMGDAVIPLYTAPPAPVVPVVPETLPCPVHLVPGLHLGKGCKTETLLIALQRRAEYYAGLDAMTPEERAEHDASIEAFKAMLPQPAPVDKEFIPKNLDKALGVVGVALPESKEEFNFQIERWIQRLIDRVIRYADEFKEQPVPVVPDDISGIIERFQYQADHLSEWHHIDEHSCKVNRRDLMTALEFMDSCRAAMLNGGKS